MTDAVAVRRLAIEALDRTAFAPFGAVVGAETADSPNFNRAPGNLGYLWVQHLLEFPKQPYVGTLRYYYRGLRCEFMQKHPASTIFLIPLGMRPSAFVVAPDTGRDQPDVDQARAFLLDGHQGIVLHRGTWVRYAYPLGTFADFAYVTQRVDPATANTTDDVVRVRLDQQLGLVFDLVFELPSSPVFEFGPSGAVVVGPGRNPPWD